MSESTDSAPDPSVRLAELLTGIGNADTRVQSIKHLCDWLTCDDLVLFLTDPELKIPLPAGGFQQTLPNGRAWRAFIEMCERNGEHRGHLSYPNPETVQPVFGFAIHAGSVVALIGGSPSMERYQLLAPWLPLLIITLRTERLAFLATQRGVADRQISAEAAALAERLDAIARENSRLFHDAEKNLAERKRVEADQRRFVALVENSSDFIGLFSASGEVLFVNSSGLSMTGLQTMAEAKGRLFEQFFSASQRTFARDGIVPQVLRSGRWTGETQLTNCSSGAVIDVHQTTFLITQPGESEPILATITRDITESKNNEERLRHTAKLESLGVMAGGIAHDFNNLLTGIMGNASLLALTRDPSEAAMAEEIVSASERAAHLTRQMLAYSGKGQFQLKRLDLSAEVRGILDVVKSSIAKNVSVQLQLQDNLPLIEADPGQIQQVIMNLVINAGEAMEGRPGTVTIQTKAQDVDSTYSAHTFGAGDLAPGRYVALEVSDTGCGMNEETQRKIFDPFFTTKFTGRGLGLAAVSGIIRGHKGALTVHSRIGEGTVFKVIFPAIAGVTSRDPVVGVKESRSRGSILVVDDELIVRHVAKSALERAGFTVIVAEDGDSGVKLFEIISEQVTAVVLDLTMPRMNGEEALQHFRRIRPDIPVIVSSGYSEVEILRRFAAERVDGVLQKPYTATHINNKVQEVVSRRSRSVI